VTLNLSQVPFARSSQLQQPTLTRVRTIHLVRCDKRHNVIGRRVEQCGEPIDLGTMTIEEGHRRCIAKVLSAWCSGATSKQQLWRAEKWHECIQASKYCTVGYLANSERVQCPMSSACKCCHHRRERATREGHGGFFSPCGCFGQRQF